MEVSVGELTYTCRPRSRFFDSRPCFYSLIHKTILVQLRAPHFALKMPHHQSHALAFFCVKFDFLYHQKAKSSRRSGSGLEEHSCLIRGSASSPQSLGLCDHFQVVEDLLSALFILGAGLLSWFIFCFEAAGGSWRFNCACRLLAPMLVSRCDVWLTRRAKPWRWLSCQGNRFFK